MALPHVAQGDPHVVAHNDERDAIDAAQSYAVQRTNHIGTQSADTLTDGATNKAFLATERSKLAGVATGATANAPDATLLARANHTGTQPASTISGLAPVATSGAYADLSGAPTSVGWGPRVEYNVQTSTWPPRPTTSEAVTAIGLVSVGPPSWLVVGDWVYLEDDR